MKRKNGRGKYVPKYPMHSQDTLALTTGAALFTSGAWTRVDESVCVGNGQRCVLVRTKGRERRSGR